MLSRHSPAQNPGIRFIFNMIIQKFNLRGAFPAGSQRIGGLTENAGSHADFCSICMVSCFSCLLMNVFGGNRNSRCRHFCSDHFSTTRQRHFLFPVAYFSRFASPTTCARARSCSMPEKCRSLARWSHSENWGPGLRPALMRSCPVTMGRCMTLR